MLFVKDYDYSLIQTTSKEALKRSALVVANYDIKKASEIYDYFAKDMPDLPTTEPVMPSSYEQLKNNATDILRWGNENQDNIVGTINMVLRLLGKKPIGIPAEAAEAATIIKPAPIV